MKKSVIKTLTYKRERERERERVQRSVSKASDNILFNSQETTRGKGGTTRNEEGEPKSSVTSQDQDR